MGEGLGFYKVYIAGMMASLATLSIPSSFWVMFQKSSMSILLMPFGTYLGLLLMSFVKLQKQNTYVQEGSDTKNGLHCASRISQTVSIVLRNILPGNALFAGVLTGGLGGIASSVSPLDVAKKKKKKHYPDKATETNPLKVLRSIHKRTGLKGCYADLGPTILRALPANAGAIVAWDVGNQT
ncbi:hypothetical protein Bca52824_043292 [Brassica carinata]|uniref:Uncharacterized protein n=1 Tax=Brassica carinata TaxID=52824 RepID=A0A8X7RYS4_BRACI|nr:hypothetical protein Bca52824_043292 [Brassica carinata]